VILAVLLLLTWPAQAHGTPACSLEVEPRSGRHFSPGDLFAGAVRLQCPPGTPRLDLHAVFALTAPSICSGDLLLAFVEPAGIRAHCAANLPGLPSPVAFLGDLAAPLEPLELEIVRTAWPSLSADRDFFWGACAAEAGSALPAGHFTCAFSRLTQPSEGGFAIELPIRAEDAANTFLGVWPFGVHGSVHTYDGGHPGWDFEYVAGAFVLAASAGTVQSVVQDPQNPARATIQLEHHHGGRLYRTVYTNLDAPLVSPGVAVSTGQPLGRAGGVTTGQGSGVIVYHMTHFQLDDFAASPPLPGVSNPSAVSPEPYLSAPARALFQQIWAGVGYDQEITEPFPTNPRTAPAPFPIQRTWRRQEGPAASSLPPRIVFVYADPATDPTPTLRHDYALVDGSGVVIETGSVRLAPTVRPVATIDLQPRDPAGQPTGPPRLGLYEIVSATMRIDWSPPGAPRPADLSSATVYTTR
jgi:hypothetical protein